MESELWEREDLLSVVKYESHKRNKAALTLMWDLNARNHEVTLLKIKHVRFHPKYAEAEIPHDSKTGGGPGLLTSSFPYVRDWLNDHPFRNEPNAVIICNLATGGPLVADSMSRIMKQLQKRIIDLISTGTITDRQEIERLEWLIKTKKWNPYCIRHSSITADSDYLPEFALRKKSRWVMNSRQPGRYIRKRMGKDVRQKILAENGIVTTEEAKPRPTVLECGRCNFVNSYETKYCSSCGYPLSVQAFEEMKAVERAEIETIQQKWLADMKGHYKLIPTTEWEKMKAEMKAIRESILPELYEATGKPIHLDADYTDDE